jgi:pyruvate kinase
VRRTKILATVGPATREERALVRLIEAGADGFRLNFSHGSDEEHRTLLRRMHSAASRLHREVAIVADLQGPKIRIGDLRAPPHKLVDGTEWWLDNTGQPGDEHRVSVTLPNLGHAVRPKDAILVGDGSIELVVERVVGEAVVTRVVHGGLVTPHAGLFLPSAHLRTEILGPKDRGDLRIALSEGIDFVALSFVRQASDITSVRQQLDRSGHAHVGLIAKIERAQALERIRSILDAADGIMVARGDLGIEVPLERLALEQKRLVAQANAAHKLVIVATQMLLSMITSPRPTRAEATDVANAVLDGADTVMLSEESAVGQYPVESVGWLDRICRATELAASHDEAVIRVPTVQDRSQERSVAQAAVDLADTLRAAALITPTHSGRTARLVASRRPRTPVLALSSEPATRRRLALTWGVQTRPCPKHLTLDALRTLAIRLALELPGTRAGSPVVLTAGYPIEGRPTNLVTVLTAHDPAAPRPARPSRGPSPPPGSGAPERAAAAPRG